MADEEPIKFWLGHILVVGLKNPVHLEVSSFYIFTNFIDNINCKYIFQKILSSSKFACKHELYVLLEGYLGDGLVSASGTSFLSIEKLKMLNFGFFFLKQHKL